MNESQTIKFFLLCSEDSGRVGRNRKEKIFFPGKIVWLTVFGQKDELLWGHGIPLLPGHSP